MTYWRQLLSHQPLVATPIKIAPTDLISGEQVRLRGRSVHADPPARASSLASLRVNMCSFPFFFL